MGQPWSKEVARRMEGNYRHRLNIQGRSEDNYNEPLSDATWKIYEQSGEPNGSGIRNHVHTVSAHQLHKAVSAMVIDKGKPTMLAIVQNDGATIAVTDAMRGYLAAHGIFLRADTLAIVIPGRRSFNRALELTKPFAKQQLRMRLDLWWQQNFPLA